MSAAMNKLSLSVESTERLGSIDQHDIPRSLGEVQASLRSRVESMEEESTDWAVRVAAVDELTTDFITSAPGGVNLGSGTHCSGVGVRADGGNTVYTHDTLTGARTPGDHRQQTGQYPIVHKRTSSGAVAVGTVKNVGRMNGAFGYSSDGNLIVGALASFTHNWVAKLLAYFQRANLPFQGGWNLPNLVLAETKEPAQFVPDASFAFTTRPALSTTFSTVVSSPTEATLGFDVWDNNKESVARVEETQIQAGENRVLVRAGPFAPSNGFFTINARKAPQGLTIKEVSTKPLSF